MNDYIAPKSGTDLLLAIADAAERHDEELLDFLEAEVAGWLQEEQHHIAQQELIGAVRELILNAS
ncbi:MAG: hypothetical protein EBY49_01530 [Actinobacteria bacterium]|jgi:hypothetical protein|nr:hypothetical protein [Actinomycetota bacterium]